MDRSEMTDFQRIDRRTHARKGAAARSQNTTLDSRDAAVLEERYKLHDGYGIKAVSARACARQAEPSCNRLAIGET